MKRNSRYQRLRPRRPQHNEERFNELLGNKPLPVREASSSDDAPEPPEMGNIADIARQAVYRPQSCAAGAQLPNSYFVITGLDFLHQVTSDDLYVLLGSFLPVAGQLMSVSVHLSNHGKRQLIHESQFGPNLAPFDRPAFLQSLPYFEDDARRYRRARADGLDEAAARADVLARSPRLQ